MVLVRSGVPCVLQGILEFLFIHFIIISNVLLYTRYVALSDIASVVTPSSASYVPSHFLLPSFYHADL